MLYNTLNLGIILFFGLCRLPRRVLGNFIFFLIFPCLWPLYFLIIGLTTFKGDFLDESIILFAICSVEVIIVKTEIFFHSALYYFNNHSICHFSFKCFKRFLRILNTSTTDILNWKSWQFKSRYTCLQTCFVAMKRHNNFQVATVKIFIFFILHY